MSEPHDPSAPFDPFAATPVDRPLTSPFGRGWIPLARDLGLPGEGGGELDVHAGHSVHDPAADAARALRQAQGERDWDSGGAGPMAAMPQVPAIAVPAVPLPGGEESARLAQAPGEQPGASPPAQPLCASAPLREPPDGPPPAPTPDTAAPPRADLFTPERQARFLAALAETGAVRSACARVGVSAQCVYLLRRRSVLFAAAWDAALVQALRVAEDVLATRALDGVEEPIFYRGEQVGSRWRFDARLLLAHLARLDTHAARSPQACARADRFDELLALVCGVEPPADLHPDPAGVVADRLEPGTGAGGGGAGAPPDPLLPVSRAELIERRVARLPARAGERAFHRCTARAAQDWQAWRTAARHSVDRLLATGAPQRPPAAPSTRPPGQAPRPGAVPPGTLSTVSTAALGMALGAGAGVGVDWGAD